MMQATAVFLFVFFQATESLGSSCFVTRRFSSTRRTFTKTALGAREQKNDGGTNSKKGLFGDYEIGSFTKAILKKTASKITGKEDYEFGDVSRALDTKAKQIVNDMTGKESYEFGDLSRAIDTKAKEMVADFTGKEDEYEFGDISKEILRRVASGEYNVEDILLLCKVLVNVGAAFSPVAAALPTKLLIEMMNISLAGELTDRLLQAIASALDERFKEALTGDKNYQVGDLTKRMILDFVGKEEYSFGDISRTIAERQGEKDDRSFGFQTKLDVIDAELEELDKKSRIVQRIT